MMFEKKPGPARCAPWKRAAASIIHESHEPCVHRYQVDFLKPAEAKTSTTTTRATASPEQVPICVPYEGLARHYAGAAKGPSFRPLQAVSTTADRTYRPKYLTKQVPK